MRTFQRVLSLQVNPASPWHRNSVITPFVVEAHAKAPAAGATELKEPETKPWGQVVPTSDVQTELWSKYARRLVLNWWHNKIFQPTVKSPRPSAEFQRYAIKEDCRTNEDKE